MPQEEAGRRPLAILGFPTASHSGVLVTGLPLGPGLARPDATLSLFADDRRDPVPLWWEPRALWPDGSLRWIFLHGRPGPGTVRCRLLPDPGGVPRGAIRDRDDAPPRASRPLVIPDDAGFRVLLGDRVLFRLEEAIRFPEDSPSRSLPALSSPANSPVPARPVSNLLEDSPVAPLFRVRFPEVRGFLRECLVRIDPIAGGAEMVWRISRTALEAGSLPAVDLRVRLPGRDAWRVDDTDRDLALQAGSWRLVLADGIRKPPCRLDPAEDGGRLRLFDPPEPFRIQGGVSFRHRIRIQQGATCPFSLAQFPAGHVPATGVLGPLADLSGHPDRSVAPGIFRGLRLVLDHGWSLAESPDPLYRGVEHYGDWPLSPGQYGTGDRCAYADNEYDAAYTYLLAHAATGDGRYLDLGLRCAEHMADVDCRLQDGAMWYHGYLEEAEDHRLRRVSGGDPGHVWTDGMWIAWQWTGDPFLREAAERVTAWTLEHFRRRRLADEFSICERNLGWPLVVAAAAMENGPETLAQASAVLAREAVSFLSAYTEDPDAAYEDPSMPTWWRCAMQDGSKPFMLGILCEGLERIHRLSGDPAVPPVLQRLAGFILDRAYDPVRVDFQYEVNAFGPDHRDIPAQQLIPLFVRSLLDSALRQPAGAMAGARAETALAALQASAWCLFDPEIRGKEVALMGRGLLPALALAEEVRRRRESARARALPPSSGRVLPRLAAAGPGSAPLDATPDGLSTDCGWIRVVFRPGDPPDLPGLNRQAFFHACDGPYNRSSVSLLAFYSRIQARFHDEDRRLIGSLDAMVDPDFFRRESGPHELLVLYRAPGSAVLAVDGTPRARTRLDRPLSGAFRRLFAGHRPGNWTLHGSVAVEAGFGTLDQAPPALRALLDGEASTGTEGAPAEGETGGIAP